MAVVSRPFNNEPDLLIGHEHKILIVTDLDKNRLYEVQPPTSGWTHDLLETYEREKLYGIQSNVLEGWELFLGDFTNWIGGSEV